MLTHLALTSLALATQDAHGGAQCPAARMYRGAFDCMQIPVYEDREASEGKELMLHVVVLPATGDDVAPDPVFILPGGPGQSSADLSGVVATQFAKVHEERDLVLVDYRGTGASNPLDFEIDEADLLAALSNPFPRELLDRELARLRPLADLTKYTTDAIVDDLNEVREALGYDQINLWGASYGSRVALVFLRRHPEHVRTAVIKAVAPLGFAIGSEFAVDAHKSLERMFDACAADPRCVEKYGDVRARFGEMLARLREAPVVVETRNPMNGEEIEFTLTADAVSLAIRSMLYSTPEHGRLPRMIAKGASGSFQEWADQVLASTATQFAQIAEGLFLTVVAAEDAPLLRSLDPDRAPPETFLGNGFAEGLVAAVDGWPCASVDPVFWEPVESDVPVLVLSGELDPVTPPNQGAEAARHLSNSLHLVFENGSHDDSAFRPCTDGVYADFFRAGTLDGLDTRCATEVRPMIFDMRD